MSFLRNTIRFLANQIDGPLLKSSTNINITLIRYTKRWVAPTLHELLQRRKKFKAVVHTARNTFPEWNLNAEIFAFGKRLNENFNTEYLRTAFVDSSYVIQEEFRQRNLDVETPLNINDNTKLVKIGEKCISEYVQSFLQFSLPNCPQEGILRIFDYLTSEKMLANLSSNIGTKDLILCADNNPNQKILRDVFVAIIGALSKSSSEERSYNFIRDFICTQLNQKDLTEVWVIENPLEKLKIICNEKELGDPNPRLIGQNAVNTVLSTFYVGIYGNKKILGKGFGESTDIAIQSAALDALCKLYGIHSSQKVFNFEIQLQQSSDQLKMLQEKN